MWAYFYVAKEKDSFFLFGLSLFLSLRKKIFSKTQKSFCVLSTLIPNPDFFIILNRYAYLLNKSQKDILCVHTTQILFGIKIYIYILSDIFIY